MSTQLEKIASFIEALPVESSTAECESVLLTGGATDSVDVKPAYNGGDCVNDDSACQGAYNGGDCRNMAGMCGSTTNTGTCGIHPPTNPCNLAC